jgi:hypothetical protein
VKAFACLSSKWAIKEGTRREDLGREGRQGGGRREEGTRRREDIQIFNNDIQQQIVPVGLHGIF